MTNVVLVHTDDTGRYIGPYGHGIETPALGELADDGVLFRNAYCAGPTCSPSRGALMTGSSPHSNGLVGLAHRGFEMDDYGRHLAGYLSERGYEATLAGQQHEVDAEDRHEAARDTLGYDRTLRGDPDTERIPFDSDRTRRDLANAARAAEYVREADGPFFLSLGLYNTHQPMPLDQDIVDPGGVQPPAPMPDVPPVREEMAGYHVLARYVDRCVGRVVGALREAGRLEETLVVFTTDHGIPFPRMKCNLFDGGIGVSLVARFPEGAGVDAHTQDALVSNVDFFPTLCEYLGLDEPGWVEGESVMPVVRGEADSVRDEVFSEVTYHAAYEPKRCVRTDRYKYIRRYGDYEGYVLPNTDPGPMKSFMLDAGFFEGTPPAEALYDCHHDPNEANNLVEDPGYADVLADLRGRLDSWMERTDDPLLDGPVTKPEGALVNPPGCADPNQEEYEPQGVR
ncbi:MAG: sulfatase [Halobacteriaceae archaeon]